MEFMQSNEISCSGKEVPKPVMSFPESNFPGKLEVEKCLLLVCLEI